MITICLTLMFSVLIGLIPLVVFHSILFPKPPLIEGRDIIPGQHFNLSEVGEVEVWMVSAVGNIHYIFRSKLTGRTDVASLSFSTFCKNATRVAEPSAI